MVARYKYKRLKEEQATDGHTSKLNLEGSERMRAKKEVKERLEEADYLTADRLEMTAKEEEEMARDFRCYAMSLADPDYVCRCFEKEDNSLLSSDVKTSS